MQSFRWDDIPFFLAVVREGTLTAAADKLGVNHTTAWRRLKALEGSLEAQLFDRTAQGYALTSAGEAMLPHAERVEDEVFALSRTVTGMQTAPAGVIRVTLPASLLPLLSPALMSFRVAHPTIELDMHLGDRFFDLDRREADVAFRPGPNPPENAVGRRVCAVAWTVFGPSTLSMEDCEKLPWVGYSDALSRLAAVQYRRERLGGQPIIRVNTVPAMRLMLAQGNCRGMLPCFAAHADPMLQPLRPPIPEAASVLWLLIHTDLRRNARVRLFVDHAWEALTHLVPVFEGQP